MTGSCGSLPAGWSTDQPTRRRSLPCSRIPATGQGWALRTPGTRLRSCLYSQAIVMWGKNQKTLYQGNIRPGFIQKFCTEV